MKTITIPQKIIPEHKINLYRFEELKENIKKELQEEYKQNHLYKYGYAWDDELYNSLETACKIFGVKTEEDTYGNLYLKYNPKDDYLNEDTARNMNFKRTIAYINNHFDFKRPPYIYKYNNSIAKWDKLTQIKIRYDEKRNNEKTKLKTADERYKYNLLHPYPKILIEKYYKKEFENETGFAYPMAVATNKMEDNLPTGYCADYVIHETYKEFVNAAKEIKQKNKKEILNTYFTLEDFLERLIRNFEKERNKDREYQESLEHLEENVYQDTWFLEDGTIWKK